MQLSAATVEGVVAGEVTTTYRWWATPAAKSGGRQRWGDVVLAVESVERVRPSGLTVADARAAGFPTLAALRRDVERFRREGTSLHRVTLRLAGDDPRIDRRRADGPDLAQRVEAARARLQRLDRSSARGPWTTRTLALIAANEGVRAPDLAVADGTEVLVFKRDVRKLKELGLTQSLEVGYRASPFGLAVLAALDPPAAPIVAPSRPTVRGRGVRRA